MMQSGAERVTRGMEGERRIITVLFCDVANSTWLASQFDPEEWAEVMNEAFQYMIAPIQEYGGMVARLMGDAVLAFFGAPQAHEDDPQRAVLAGLGIVNGMRPFCRQFHADYGLDFAVRVGINTGPVVVGEIGSNLMQEYTAMGDAINLAARMEQTALPGTVQISDDTYRLVGPMFDVWDLGGIDVKGRDEPVPAFRVLSVLAQPGTLRGLEGMDAHLVGRDREMARLLDGLKRVYEGESRVCFLVGEAGLGKTRLIRELRTQWRAKLAETHKELPPFWSGWTEFLAVSYGASRPYDMLKRQLRRYCGIRESDAPAVIDERLHTLVDMYPEEMRERIHRVFSILLGDARAGAPAPLGEAFQRELRSVIVEAAEYQASRGPMIYVLDDVHWADPASTESMRDLLELAQRRPMLFIIAMRPDWNSPAWQLFVDVQIDFADQTAAIFLEPLSREHSRELLVDLLGDAGVPQPVVEAILQKAEGNPLFIEELIRALQENNIIIEGEDGPVWRADADVEAVVDLVTLPGNVQALMTARIDRLSGDDRRLLQLASILGRSFYRRELQQLVGEEVEISESLSRLTQADLIRPSGAGDVEYTFLHALARDAAYETVLIRQRRRYHRQVGEVIEVLNEERLPEESPRLAYHFAEARDWARAVKYYVYAGQAAARLYANAEAIEHFSHAIEIALANPTLVNEETLVDALLRCGRVYEVSGRFTEALEQYRLLEQLGNERGRSLLQLEALKAQALLFATPTLVMDRGRAEEAAASILALAKATGRQEAEAHAHWIELLVYLNLDTQATKAVASGETALAIAKASGPDTLQAHILNDIARAYNSLGRTADAIAAYEEAESLWRELGNDAMLTDTLGMRAFATIDLGKVTEVEAIARDGLALSERIHNPWGMALNRNALGWALIAQGEIGEGIRVLWLAIESAEQANFSFGLPPSVAVILQWVHTLLGAPRHRHDELEQIVLRAGVEHQIPATWDTWRVLDLLAEDDAASAAELAASFAPPDTNTVSQDEFLLRLIIAHTQLTAGRYDEAMATAAAALALLDQFGMETFRVDLLIRQGMAAAALGETLLAQSTLEAASTLASGQTDRFAEWLAAAELARLAPPSATAEAGRQRASELARYLAGRLDDQHLRDSFLRLPQNQAVMSSE